MRALFAAWGRVVHRHPWPVLGGAAVLFALSAAGLGLHGTLVSGNQFGRGLEASRASEEASRDLMRAMLEDAYERGRAEGVERMREVYRVIVFAGKTVSEAPVPADLKSKVGL